MKQATFYISNNTYVLLLLWAVTRVFFVKNDILIKRNMNLAGFHSHLEQLAFYLPYGWSCLYGQFFQTKLIVKHQADVFFSANCVHLLIVITYNFSGDQGRVNLSVSVSCPLCLVSSFKLLLLLLLAKLQKVNHEP